MICAKKMTTYIVSDGYIKKGYLSRSKKHLIYQNENSNEKNQEWIIKLKTPFKSRILFNGCIPCESYKAKLQIITKYAVIELLPMKFKALKCPLEFVPEGLRFKCHCTINITQITNYEENTSDEKPVVVEYCKNIEYGRDFLVPVTSDGNNVVLMPKNKYELEVSFSVDPDDNSGKKHIQMYCIDKERTFEDCDISIRPQLKDDKFFLPVGALGYNAILLDTKRSTNKVGCIAF